MVVPPSRPLLLVPGVGGSRLCARRRGSAAPPIDVYFRFWRPDTTFQEFLFSRWDEAAGEIVPVNPDVEVRGAEAKRLCCDETKAWWQSGAKGWVSVRCQRSSKCGAKRGQHEISPVGGG